MPARPRPLYQGFGPVKVGRGEFAGKLEAHGRNRDGYDRCSKEGSSGRREVRYRGNSTDMGGKRRSGRADAVKVNRAGKLVEKQVAPLSRFELVLTTAKESRPNIKPMSKSERADGCTYSRFFDTNCRPQSFIFNKIWLADLGPEKAGIKGGSEFGTLSLRFHSVKR